MKIFCIAVVLLSLKVQSESSQGKLEKPQLHCDELHLCLNNGSRACWKRFYEEGSKRNDLIGDVLKVFPEADFLHFVDESENEMWPEFYQLDKNVTDCMSDSGYRNYIDFCSNMRSSKFNDQTEKAIEAAEKEHQKAAGQRQRRQATATNDSKCWVSTMRTCTSQYGRSGTQVDGELEKCEKMWHAVSVEKQLGFEVGKSVMLKVVAKIKEAFESSVVASTINPNEVKGESAGKPAVG